MFVVDVPAFPYEEPWTRPLSERLRTLARRSFRVLYLYETADNSTFRYRAFNMQAAWNAGDSVSSAFAFYNELPALLRSSLTIDILVVCRCRYTDLLAECVAQAKRRGVRVYYDIDDSVFSPAKVHLVLNTLAQDLAHPSVWDFWHAYTSRMREAMRLCDGAITTNDYLAAHIEAELGLYAVVVPNALNSMQIEASDVLYDAKVRNGFARAVNFQLGYFSGTPSHEKDFEIAESAIVEMLRRHPDVVLRVVGFLRDREAFRPYRNRIELYSLHDFVNLQRVIAHAEVNLVPLQDNMFTNCKSELKYFEAAVVGTPSVATPIHSYASAIRHGENGLLALAHEWQDQLERLIVDETLLVGIAQRAHGHARAHYHPDAQRGALQEAFFGPAGLERVVGR